MEDYLREQTKKASELLALKLDLEIRLKAVSDELDIMLEGVLIDELLVLGVKELTLEGGYKIKVKKDYFGSIGWERCNDAAAFLGAKGYSFNWRLDALLKNGTQVSLAKKELENIGIDSRAKPDIHPQTFKKICRELDEMKLLGDEAQQKLGVTIRTRAIVTAP